MATAFSGGTYVNTTFTGSSKSAIISAIQTQLTNAGWSVASGGGTTNLLMKTALGADGSNQICVRFKDNSGTCVQVTLENVAGTLVQANNTSTGGNLWPNSQTYTILASKYRFEIFTSSKSARECVMAGILFIPSAMTSTVTTAAYLMCNSQSDTDTTGRSCMFYTMDCCQNATFGGFSQAGQGNTCCIVNSTKSEKNGAGNNFYSIAPVLVVPANSSINASYSDSGGNSTNGAYRWFGGLIIGADPLMALGTTTADNGEAQICGQPYDWTVLRSNIAAGTTDSWSDGGSSHNFYCLNAAGGGQTSSALPGTIWVAYS